LLLFLFSIFLTFVVSKYTSGVNSIFEYYYLNYFDYIENFVKIQN
jgi:hypothetical protein